MDNVKNLRINVTQWHIDEGRQCSRNSCPLALALRDMGFGQVEVRGGVNPGEGITLDGVYIPHTPRTKHFVALVDHPTTSVSPQILNLPVPERVYNQAHNRKNS